MTCLAKTQSSCFRHLSQVGIHAGVFLCFMFCFFGAVVNSGSPNQLRLTGQGMGAEGGRQNRLVTWLKATFPATPRACTSQHQRGVINVPAEAALRLWPPIRLSGIDRGRDSATRNVILVHKKGRKWRIINVGSCSLYVFQRIPSLALTSPHPFFFSLMTWNERSTLFKTTARIFITKLQLLILILLFYH